MTGSLPTLLASRDSTHEPLPVMSAFATVTLTRGPASASPQTCVTRAATPVNPPTTAIMSVQYSSAVALFISTASQVPPTRSGDTSAADARVTCQRWVSSSSRRHSEKCTMGEVLGCMRVCCAFTITYSRYEMEISLQ